MNKFLEHFGKLISNKSAWGPLFAIFGVLSVLLVAGFTPPYFQKKEGTDFLLGLTAAICFLFSLKFTRDLKDAEPEKHPHRPPDEVKHYDHVYETSESVDFYDVICEVYDKRNTKEYYNTYKTVLEVLKDIISENTIVRICDLGGGTSALYDKFKNYDNIEWTYIDLSSNMYDFASKRFVNKNFKAYHSDVADINITLPAEEKFDIFIMSFLLSSLQNDPDFSIFKTRLNNGGLFVIADAHPDYATDKPYAVEVNNETHALKTRSFNLEDLQDLMENHGFVKRKRIPVKKGNKFYSQVIVFETDER